MSQGIQPYTTYQPPTAGVGAVNIQIYNPTVNAPSGQNPGQTAPMQLPLSQSVVNNTNQTNNNVPTTASAPPPAPPEVKKDEPKKAEPPKQKVMLTDDYIKLLDQYLNDTDASKRLIGIKEVLKRFKEDIPARKSDEALTNLLNRALQDPSQGVRLIALSILKSNYATGNDLTLQILQKMKQSKDIYDQDSSAASEILLDKAGQNLNIQSSADNTPLANQQAVSSTKQTPDAVPVPVVGQKLNVVSQ